MFKKGHVHMLQKSRNVLNRFLNEETFKLIKTGYFAVYKRPNLTSAEELEELKNAIVCDMGVDEAVRQERFILKVGHGGTLDKMASGVLAVGVCDGCKVLPAFLSSSKRYTVTGRLGLATDTYNSLGVVVAEARYDHITRTILEELLKEYEGEVWQKPPPYSALKIKGERASDIIRSGKKVNLVPRPVMCYSAHCLEFEPPFFTLDVSCGQGFYVRSLIHDVAEALGSCAHVTALVRTKHGPFTLEDSLYPEKYTRENIITAVQDAQRKHPQLLNLIEKYYKNLEEKQNYGAKKHKGKEKCIHKRKRGYLT